MYTKATEKNKNVFIHQNELFKVPVNKKVKMVHLSPKQGFGAASLQCVSGSSYFTEMRIRIKVRNPTLKNPKRMEIIRSTTSYVGSTISSGCLVREECKGVKMSAGVPHEEVPGQDRQPYRPHPGRDGRRKGARVEKVRGCNKNKTASR